MILAIRKPIARFMRYAFGRQYVFVLTRGRKIKLRRVFISDWDGSRCVREQDSSPGPQRFISLDDDRAMVAEFKGWREATFTEAERKAQAVMNALAAESQLTNTKATNAQTAKVPQIPNPMDMASFAAAYKAAMASAKMPPPPRP